jgi:outer membrane protein assembly factor BamD
MRRTAWLMPCLAAVLLAGCGGHVLPEIHSEADRLSTARRLYAEREYAGAIELLKTYTESAGGSADVDDAIYLLGACYLGTHEWSLAAVEFERLLKDYPESDSSAAASFRLGQAYYGQSRKADFDQEYTLKALDQWQSYLTSYPNHWLQGGARGKIREARTRLAKKLVATGNLYIKLNLTQPARVYFQRALDEYGDSEMRPRAELGLALADARQNKRDHAIVALREIETRYPGLPVARIAARERRRLERHKKS